MFKSVPFNSEWLTHDTLDLHAVYRRPMRDQSTGDLARDEYGFLRWDLTGPLPVRSHARWTAKGFHYITLATIEDVINASDADLATSGVHPIDDPRQYLNQGGVRGPWNPGLYLEDMANEREERAEALRARVAKNGPQDAEMFERQRDPDYVLPESMKPQDAVKRGPGRPRKEEAVA